MSLKIKSHIFHFLFRLLAYLADLSGGWRVFVRPKLFVGSLIIGMSIAIQGQVEAKNQSSNQKQKKEWPKDISDTIQPKIVEETIFCYVMEQMPLYPGGENELLKFIAKNLKYPESAILNKIQGKIIVRFRITEKGNIDKIEVVRSLYPACDQEAIRIVKSLSNFTPGKQNGKNTDVWYTLPVTFKLENNGRKN